MRPKNFNFRILILAIILLILAQGFNGSLSISAFEKLYLNSLISSYQVLGKDLQRNIQSAVRFGKLLKKFIGINQLLEEMKAKMPDIDNVRVALNTGEVRFSIQKGQEGTQLPSALNIDFSEEADPNGNTETVVVAEGSYHILLPIRDNQGQWLGTIDISFKEEIVQNRIAAIIIRNLKILGLTTLLAAILLGIGLNFWVSHQGKGLATTRIYIIVLIILTTAQIFYSIFSVNFFKDNYVGVTRLKSEALTKLLKEDIEYLLTKGIHIDRLFKIDVLMSEIVQATPEIEDMRILSAEKDLLYLANHQGVVNVQKTAPGKKPEMDDTKAQDSYNIILPLQNKAQLEGYIRVQLSKSVIGDKIREIILDSVTVVIISLLFIVELLFFLLLYIRKQIQDTAMETVTSSPVDAYKIIRRLNRCDASTRVDSDPRVDR